jgi:hypothetical protein
MDAYGMLVLRTIDGKLRLFRPEFMSAMLLVAVMLLAGPLAALANAQPAVATEKPRGRHLRRRAFLHPQG